MGSAGLSEINFRLGWPNPGLLPVKELQSASQTALSKSEALTKDSLLEYGPDHGYIPLRNSIATWLSSFYQPKAAVTADRICISGGASQNLSCVLQAFTDPAITQYIWMVAPTYFCACRVFDDVGFAGRLRAVPEDDEGLDVVFLAEELARCEPPTPISMPATKTRRSWNKTYRHVIYAVPTFANPSGRIMSLARRETLVRIARQYDALVVTDDVYDMLQWDCQPSKGQNVRKTACQPRVVDIDAYLDGGPIDDFGNSVSQGSFSKILGPGLRTGWAEGTLRFAWGLSQCGQTRSGGCASQFTAAILSEMVETSLPQYMQTVLQPTYARRYRTMMDAVVRHLLPLGISTPVPDRSGTVGGYYVWLQLPETVRAAEVVKVAREEMNLLLHPGSLFLVEGDASKCQLSFLNGVRVCFVWAEEELIVAGVERLAAVVEALSA
ncbi:hypothetical protein LTR85_006384 [Meristemomyces frigidus]|nr:hypothetical protein LTR85_006384 [Meristemomyces frigidus]